MISDLYRQRRAFWALFAATAPGLWARTVYGSEHTRWLSVGHRPLVIALFVANRGVGLFVRGPAREPVADTKQYLAPHRHFLAERLGNSGLKLGSMFLVPRSIRTDMTDRDNWPAAIDWFGDNTPVYERVFTDLQSQPQEWPDLFPAPDFDESGRADDRTS